MTYDHKRTNTPHAAGTPCDILSIGGPLPPFGYVEDERVWSMWGDEEGALEGLEAMNSNEPTFTDEVEREARFILAVHLRNAHEVLKGRQEARRIARGRGIGLTDAARLVVRGWTLERMAAWEAEAQQPHTDAGPGGVSGSGEGGDPMSGKRPHDR